MVQASVIEKLNANLVKEVVNLDGSSSNQVDLFVLVVKLDPRPASLKADLSTMRKIFGDKAIKSTILLFIVHYSKVALTDDQIHEQIKELTEINSIIREAKGVPGASLDRDWYVLWDNVKPKPNQLQELINKSSKVTGYTNEMFLQRQK